MFGLKDQASSQGQAPRLSGVADASRSPTPSFFSHLLHPKTCTFQPGANCHYSANIAVSIFLYNTKLETTLQPTPLLYSSALATEKLLFCLD